MSTLVNTKPSRYRQLVESRDAEDTDLALYVLYVFVEALYQYPWEHNGLGLRWS